MERPMTIREAAEFLSITPHQMRVFLRQGIIKGFRVGREGKGHWRILKDDLMEYINKGMNNG